ncbi:zinc-binding alcohol dehydrogenase family protein [Dyadobacter sp. NIV53]|uniref:zinc-binding alcohol dehydrogenase family protein n=1 Tax=Dyadobacter sp. NIV53 TaxID=2861765 RepID=UPI001C86FCA8
MKAVGLHKYLPIEDPESLLDLEIGKPVATGRDLLVNVKAIGVNPVDYKVRSPKDKIEGVPKILGWDVAGIVEEVGKDVSLFKAGDEVYYSGTMTRQGGNSEFHLVDERLVGKKPGSLSFAEAAALPLTTITAYEGLFTRLGISRNAEQNSDRSILIIGGAGGVGSIAIQLAKLAGLKVIATASRPESARWIKELGADNIVDHSKDIAEQLREFGTDEVDYIFNVNNTLQYWKVMSEVIAPQGKICMIVEAAGDLNFNLFKNKSVTISWELMFTRSTYQTTDMIEQHNLLNEVSGLVDSGKIKTTLGDTLSPINAENLRIAHARLESGSAIGKIVLKNF